MEGSLSDIPHLDAAIVIFAAYRDIAIRVNGHHFARPETNPRLIGVDRILFVWAFPSARAQYFANIPKLNPYSWRLPIVPVDAETANR